MDKAPSDSHLHRLLTLPLTPPNNEIHVQEHTLYRTTDFKQIVTSYPQLLAELYVIKRTPNFTLFIHPRSILDTHATSIDNTFEHVKKIDLGPIENC